MYVTSEWRDVLLQYDHEAWTRVCFLEFTYCSLSNQAQRLDSFFKALEDLLRFQTISFYENFPVLLKIKAYFSTNMKTHNQG